MNITDRSPLETAYAPVLERLRALAEGGGPALVAIDGRCGSGKTALAGLIAQVFPCNLFHMDDFYLPKELRAPDWMEIPGGNMDFARILSSVLEPVRAGKALTYRPYDCRLGGFGPAVTVPPQPLNVIEGSYCLHPRLRDRYDLRVFLTCGRETQARRLRRREGERFHAYQDIWIPLEERYLKTFHPEEAAHLNVDTSDLF